MLLKNLDMFEHCKNLSHVGNQLIFFSSPIATWALLSALKKYLKHLFWDVWIF